MKKTVRPTTPRTAVLSLSTLASVTGGESKTKTSDKNAAAVLDFIKG